MVNVNLNNMSETSTTQKLTLVINSLDTFGQFLSRFSKMEKQILIEITPLHLKAKLGTVDKTSLKSEQIDIESVFQIDEFEAIPDLIKIGILNINKLIEAFKHFNDKQVTFTIHYITDGSDLIVKNIELSSTSLSINFDCTEVEYFTYISDQLLENITSKNDVSLFFKLTKDQFAKMLDLTKFSNGEEDLIAVDIDSSNNIVIESIKTITNEKKKNFTFIIDKTDARPKNFSSAYFKKQYFNFVDKDTDHIVYIKDDGMLFESTENAKLKLLIGKADS